MNKKYKSFFPQHNILRKRRSSTKNEDNKSNGLERNDAQEGSVREFKPASDYTDAHHKAATKLQAFFRGKNKHLKSEQHVTNNDGTLKIDLYDDCSNSIDGSTALQCLASVVRAGVPYQYVTIAADLYSKARMPLCINEFNLVQCKPNIENQNASGYCWLYASACMIEQYLNCNHPMRNGACSNYHKVSIAYWQYYDVLEKANSFLELVLLSSEKPINGRYMHTLLSRYPQDGGWFNYAQNLVKKYGLLFKKNYHRTPAASSTHSLNVRLNLLVKSAVPHIRKYMRSKDEESARKIKKEMMCKVVALLNIFMAPPPTRTDEEETYSNYVSKYLDSFMMVIHDPCFNSDSDDRVVEIDSKINIVGMPGVKFVRCKEIADMLSFTTQQLCSSTPIKRTPVWFGSTWSLDRIANLDRLCTCTKDPITDLPTTKCEQTQLGTNVGEHATCLVGYKQNNESIEFLIQNSHGVRNTPGRGYLIMTQEWFEQYGLVVVISKETLKKNKYNLNKTTKVPIWDGEGVA